MKIPMEGLKIFIFVMKISFLVCVSDEKGYNKRVQRTDKREGLGGIILNYLLGGPRAVHSICC